MKVSASKKNSPLWWEKTVEYKFICDCVKNGIINNICPLDGDEEALGDTLASLTPEDVFDENDRIFILEFKRTFDSKCLKAETNKFKPQKDAEGYQIAKKCFEKSDMNKIRNSHYLIAAEYSDNFLELLIRDYFDFDTDKKKSSPHRLIKKME